jgi:tRNA A37 threonylcarbamoyladenosine biosynthesis protein TsaE
MDLYRLSGRPQDMVPLNLDHVFNNCVALIEWPSRLTADRIPETRLEISMRISSEDISESDGDSDESSTSNDKNDNDDDCVRTMTLQPYGAVWEERLQRLLADGYVDDLLAGDE